MANRTVTNNPGNRGSRPTSDTSTEHEGGERPQSGKPIPDSKPTPAPGLPEQPSSPKVQPEGTGKAGE